MGSKLFNLLFERFNALVIPLKSAAQISGMSYQNARQMASEGRLPFVSFKVGGLRMVKLTDLVDWLENVGTSPAAPASLPPPAQEATAKRQRGRPPKLVGV